MATAASPGKLIKNPDSTAAPPIAAPECVLAGAVEVEVPDAEVTVLLSSLVTFLHDEVAFDGTVAELDKVRSAHCTENDLVNI
jgi:hypothetical protein